MLKLTDEIRGEGEYKQLLEALNQKNNKRPVLISGLCEGAEISLAVSLCSDMKMCGALLIMPDEKRVSKMADTLNSYGIKTYSYLYRDMVFRNIASSHDPEHERLKVLCALINATCDAVVTTSDALLQLTVPPERLEESSLLIQRSEEYNIEDIVDFLNKNNYKRTDMVDGIGQYSLRGGIIDIFAPGTNAPVRIDFFGDEIDSMGYFDIISQRTSENCDELFLSPCREVLLNDASVSEIKKIISSRIKQATDDGIKNRLREELEVLSSGRELYCIDKYISVVYPEKACLADYCSGMQVMAFDMPQIVTRQKAKDALEAQNIVDMLSKGEISPRCAEYTYGTPRLEDFVFNAPSVITNNFGAGFPGKKFSGLYTFKTQSTVSYKGKYDLLFEDIKSYLLSKFRIKVMCETEQAAKNLADMLNEGGINAYPDDGRELKPGHVATVWGQDIPGYELPVNKFVCLHAAESSVILKGKGYIRRKQKKDKNLQRILSYAELNVGDYIVHAVHGIGIYKGLRSKTVDGVTKDYIELEYLGGDKLFIPCTQLERISKHIGASSENGTLKLSRMGGADFAKVRLKAKASAKSIAKELIQLYAERSRRPGFAFPPDDEMQAEFDAAFEYEETDCQLNAIEDIKADMEKAHPMDRLLCGDVGYGKTEVAIRAAFKAAAAGKQIAILVPTTILAMQHYRTFVSRMRGFPVSVDMISRFRTPKEQEESLRKLRRGETDIIIGTHRLLSKDIEFKDLGLLIVDEEQRFGVTHKEKLKQMSKNIDVLTLSATPIPRTLNMAISGIRDISLLDEAPGDRFPVHSFVTEYDDDIIGEAISRELRRGGQVFYLCNRIEKMQRVAEKISKIVPDAVIATANGQMDKEELSEIWQEMVDGKIDILVSTTIIETGVDIPNANTLIVENANAMGLSQLHQLRGRVGRSSRRAYAYFTYPKNKELTEISEKRLEAIRDFTEFGAGFRIAMRDMEIRGAGDLLGADQHGHMESIGYDLFMKLLEEAVLEEKGESKKESPECTIEIGINAFIPEYYIPSTNQRIDAYRKISLIEQREDYYDIYDELSDRFGSMPDVTENLLSVSLLRKLAGKAGFAKIERKGTDVMLCPETFDFKLMSDIASFSGGKMSVRFGKDAYLSMKTRSPQALLDECISIFDKYLKSKQKEEKSNNNPAD